ncbi:MAG: hypothetical protein Kapaf2KO_02750 [Candidatus Kapaibacteriales bacterium]
MKVNNTDIYRYSQANRISSSEYANIEPASAKINGAVTPKINPNNNELITDGERQFFKKLFPDSKQLIEMHEVFNRNGSVSNSGVKKGVILDVTI